MKYLLFLILLVSCTKEPISRESTNNSEFSVALLFEHDGCKVYRFADGGSAKYYTNCTSTMVTRSYPCGKSTCTEKEEITTGKN